MKFLQLFLALFFVMSADSAIAQFSVYSRYISNQVEWQDDWQNYVSDDVIYQSSVQLGLGYWLRLKNYRVEFHPGVYYTNSQTEISSNQVVNVDDIQSLNNVALTGFGVEVPIHIYLMDIEGDCNCPTFSKDGDFFSKGFYVFLNPGYAFMTHELTGMNTDNSSFEQSKTDNVLTASAGVGIDIGLGDLFTISPHVGYYTSPNNTMESLALAVGSAAGDNLNTTRNVRGFFGGIRLAFRPDYVKQRRAMFR